MNRVKNCDRRYSGRELEAMSFAYNYQKWIIDEFEPYFGRNVVEVGAGVGNFSSMLLKTNLHHLYAFEPASNLYLSLCKRMKGQSRVSLINEYFEAGLSPAVIDSILYVNVLEHIEDDRAELAKTYQALSSGGYLLIFVPALQWLFSEADTRVGHYRRYYKTNIEELVVNTGFSITKSRYFDLAGVLPWYVNFVILKHSFNAASISLYDRVVVPPMRIFEKFIKPPVGKNILMVARKD